MSGWQSKCHVDGRGHLTCPLPLPFSGLAGLVSSATLMGTCHGAQALTPTPDRFNGAWETRAGTKEGSEEKIWEGPQARPVD